MTRVSLQFVNVAFPDLARRGYMGLSAVCECGISRRGDTCLSAVCECGISRLSQTW